MSDKYDEAIAYFKIWPREIPSAWDNFGHHKHGCLFQFLTPDGVRDPNMKCGCPTMVRAGVWDAFTSELAEAVKADDRIPSDRDHITVESLPAFAEIQRLADRTIRNT